MKYLHTIFTMVKSQ